MVIDDVLIGKSRSIAKCIKRIEEEYAGDPSNLENITILDAITLNLQRACESSIDLAMSMVKRLGLGIPDRSRDSFDMLKGAGVIDPGLCENMKRMVGFRNIAVHQYQDLSTAVIENIIARNMRDFTEFVEAVRRHDGGSASRTGEKN